MRLAPPTHLRDLVLAQGQALAEEGALWATNGQGLSYGELAAQVRRAGATLRGLGVGPEDRIALALPNGPELAAAFVSVAAHAPAAPLNPDYPEAELDYFLTDLAARALVLPGGADIAAAEVARARRIPVIELVASRDAPVGTFVLRGEPVAPAVPDRPGRPDDVALILYTSGTTSRPRLVPLSHRNVCVAATNTGLAFALGTGDRCLNPMPLFHAHGLTSTLLASLVTGASVICPAGFDAARFFAWLTDLRPTWYTAVPAMHKALLEVAPDHPGEAAASALRFIRSASAPLSAAMLDRLERTFQAPVIEAYGMTEASSLVTSNPIPPGVRKRGSVGVPVGEDVMIMDEAGQSLPAGHPGEIAIRGANVMGGYGNDRAANLMAFVNGWLRTGDYGYLDEDGYLFIVGRTKEIINRGGSKVSPAEVDEALADHPDIAQVAVFGLPHATLGEDVAAAVVPRAGSAITEHEVRVFAAARLAAHKVPSRIFIVADVPRSATGKVQRLRLAEQLGHPEDAPPATPGTTTEAAIATIWAGVLKVEQVSVYENFFELGGDSLLLAGVAERLKADLGHDVPVAALVMHPTVRALARYLDANEGAAGGGRPSTDEVRRRAESQERIKRQRRIRGVEPGEAG